MKRDVHWNEVNTGCFADRTNDLWRRPGCVHERCHILGVLPPLKGGEVRRHGPFVDHVLAQNVAAELSHTLEREEWEGCSHADGGDADVLEREVLH